MNWERVQDAMRDLAEVDCSKCELYNVRDVKPGQLFKILCPHGCTRVNARLAEFSIIDYANAAHENCEVAEWLAGERLSLSKSLAVALSKNEQWFDKCWQLLNEKEELLRKLYEKEN